MSTVLDLPTNPCPALTCYSLRYNVHPTTTPIATMEQHIIDYLLWSKFIPPQVAKFPLETVLEDNKNLLKHFKYILGYEISPLGVHHVQAVVWYKFALCQTNRTKIRNYFKKYAPPKPPNTKKYQPVSFTKSIKPASLASYCTKDGICINNLSSEEVNRIQEWREDLKKNNQDKTVFTDVIKDMQEWIDSTGIEPQLLWKHCSDYDMCKKINDIWYKYSHHPLLNQKTYYRIAYHVKLISFQQIQSNLNIKLYRDLNLNKILV